ncbi:hypothetical protein PLESTM_001893800 [Pleodorina starrii]|nr:hypothetical protein PLESTM_001893800 [Pleodorina starrii]
MLGGALSKVKWFERRVNLEPSTKGIEESEREVFELEDTDVNPIGCISGKCHIVKAANYEEAYSRRGNAPGWFFCRGYFHQSSNSFVAYTPAEMAVGNAHDAVTHLPRQPGADGPTTGHPHPQQPPRHGLGAPGNHPQLGSDVAARGSLHASAIPHEALPSSYANGGGGAATAGAAGGSPYDVDEESDEQMPVPTAHSQLQQRRQAQQHHPPAQQQPASKRQKATGRTCVECGATTTPQWREGPMGPKTLCNACGVRYVRSQQKAAGQKRSGAGQKNGQGRPQDLTSPRAQQQAGVTKRGSSQKVRVRDACRLSST